MPDWSRRRALHAVAGIATLALAGCSGEASTSHTAPYDPHAEPVTDYELQTVRIAEETPLFEYGDESREQEPRDGRWRSPSYHHLTTEEESAEIRFRSDVSEAETLRRFVDATDFESQSLFLLQRGVPACYEARLVSVTRESDSVHADFCEDLKPADVSCQEDARELVGVAIRLPFPGDSFNGLGVGWSSSCHERPRPVDFRNETTLERDAGEGSSSSSGTTASAGARRPGGSVR